tara:strand:- start:308 stop:841 length:534 start_codon:yes stop_codon:yes gene_type:complete
MSSVNLESENKYTTSKIYAIRSPSTPKYYIGSTTLDLKLRHQLHKYHYTRYLVDKFNYMTSFDIIEFGDSFIEEIEMYPCINKRELHQREGQHIRSHRKLTVCHLVNKKIDGRTPQEYITDNIDSIKQYRKEYRDINKVYYQQYMKDWLSVNPDYMKQYQQNYREKKRLESNVSLSA